MTWFAENWANHIGLYCERVNICFFCGPTERRITEEHIWPLWVSRLLMGRYDSDHFRNLRSDASNTTANWKSKYLDTTSSTVCDRCNSVWLSQLENDVIKPFASALIAGDDVTILTPEQQASLAAWAYKMALLLEVPDIGGREPFLCQPNGNYFETSPVRTQTSRCSSLVTSSDAVRRMQ